MAKNDEFDHMAAGAAFAIPPCDLGSYEGRTAIAGLLRRAITEVREQHANEVERLKDKIWDLEHHGQCRGVQS